MKMSFVSRLNIGSLAVVTVVLAWSFLAGSAYAQKQGSQPSPLTSQQPVAAHCPKCETLEAAIHYLDGQISSQQAQDTSIRKYSNLKDPHIQDALTDIANRITKLQAEKQKYQEKLAKCQERCVPAQETSKLPGPTPSPSPQPPPPSTPPPQPEIEQPVLPPNEVFSSSEHCRTAAYDAELAKLEAESEGLNEELRKVQTSLTLDLDRLDVLIKAAAPKTQIERTKNLIKDDQNKMDNNRMKYRRVWAAIWKLRALKPCPPLSETPPSAPPPEEKKDEGETSGPVDFFGNVSIGIGIGGGDHHDHDHHKHQDEYTRQQSHDGGKSSAAEQACCTHQGQSVKCPSGLPAGSRSVEFVQGGTSWATPTGGQVFVPQTSFPACR